MAIRSFRSKALSIFWRDGNASKVAPDLHDRLRVRLSALSESKKPSDMDVPGFDFHRLRGKPLRYTVHVNGPFCVTFEWDGEDAVRVDLDNYH